MTNQIDLSEETNLGRFPNKLSKADILKEAIPIMEEIYKNPDIEYSMSFPDFINYCQSLIEEEQK